MNGIKNNVCFPIIHYNFPIIYNIIYYNHKNDDKYNIMMNKIEKKIRYISDIINTNYILVYTELADGTLQDFIENENYYNYENYIYTIIQIVFTVYYFHKYVKHYHNDLHWGNMLFYKNIDYFINGKNIHYLTKNINGLFGILTLVFLYIKMIF